MKEFNKELIMRPKTVVHCKTLEQAKELLNWADSIGLKWTTNESYLDDNGWNDCKKDTCYYLTAGKYGSKHYYKKYEHKILSFEDALIKESNNPSFKGQLVYPCNQTIVSPEDCSIVSYTMINKNCINCKYFTKQEDNYNYCDKHSELNGFIGRESSFDYCSDWVYKG